MVTRSFDHTLEPLEGKYLEVRVTYTANPEILGDEETGVWNPEIIKVTIAGVRLPKELHKRFEEELLEACEADMLELKIADQEP